MKQTVVLLTLFLLAGTISHAQKQTRFFTEVLAGPSFPIGKFADKTYADKYKQQPPGLAKTGWSAAVSVGYSLNQSIGLLLAGGYSVHKQDLSGYARSLYTPFSDPMPNLTFNGQYWKEVNIRGGAFFALPLTPNGRLNLVTKLTAGICKTAVPGYDWNSVSDNGSVRFEGVVQKIDLAWGFCYQADVALKYKLGNHLYVMLNVASFNALPRKEFKPAGYYPYYSGGKTQFNLNTINAMAGIGIDF